MDMVERVAGALKCSAGFCVLSEAAGIGESEFDRLAVEIARAAIQAMREPTAPMLEQGRRGLYDCAVHDGYGGIDTGPPVDVWQKMIDAALSSRSDDLNGR